MMRVILAVGFAVALAACNDKSATDGASAPGSAPAGAPAAPAASAHPADAAAFTKYVPWNHAYPEIKKTGSGMEYVVLVSGPANGVSPVGSQEVEVFYEGRFNSGGPAFDSAFERGESSTFAANRVVPGFSEALKLMKPGDRWLVFIPSALGYGPEGKDGRIPPNADLVFEIEMVKVAG